MIFAHPSDKSDYRIIPNKYLKIEDGVCKGLSPEGLTANYDDYDTLMFPKECTSVGDNAFSLSSNVNVSFKSNLTSIIFDDACNLTSIGDNAFKNLPKLEEAEFPDSLNSFGISAFENDIEFTLLQLNSNSVLDYSSNLLKNTLFNSDEELNEGMIIVSTEALVNSYRQTDGWNQFPDDAIQVNDE
jgi:hypothetical protein